MGEGRRGDRRVLRGGSWINNGRNCRSAYRNHNDPSNRNNNTGFRLARAQRAVGMSVCDQTFIPFSFVGCNNQRALHHVVLYWCNALRLLTPYGTDKKQGRRMR
ncbi:SUMF1/EgtB/PvdO family nonheme iron enzyme [Nitrosomonas sp.]|uniref:formylglycine-generating enzyme family protein n=1 Tax=Nitrosomonas sp. TaxID=42353 RepID=UPI0025E20F7E|nr:SUMF1/EgtB/PvdO family nonheme iron enzyme [Nitrosomonas sp.]